MNRLKKWYLVAAGGSIAAVAIGAGVAMAQTPPSTPSPSSTATTQATPTTQAQGTSSADTFTPNEDPTHEANESAEQEALEDSGQAPGGGHRGNCPKDQQSGDATPSATPSAGDSSN